jgi:hypothetical protein
MSSAHCAASSEIYFSKVQWNVIHYAIRRVQSHSKFQVSIGYGLKMLRPCAARAPRRIGPTDWLLVTLSWDGPGWLRCKRAGGVFCWLFCKRVTSDNVGYPGCVVVGGVLVLVDVGCPGAQSSSTNRIGDVGLQSVGIASSNRTRQSSAETIECDIVQGWPALIGAFGCRRSWYRKLLQWCFSRSM